MQPLIVRTENNGVIEVDLSLIASIVCQRIRRLDVMAPGVLHSKLHAVVEMDQMSFCKQDDDFSYS